MRILILIGLLLIIAMSCEKEKIEYQEIQGNWIEQIHKSDTLEFASDYSGFNLKRGVEIRNGHLLPKFSSGPYSYEIIQDSIALKWGLSSYSGSINYYFEHDKEMEQIRIGNFFVDSLNHKNEILTFITIN